MLFIGLTEKVIQSSISEKEAEQQVLESLSWLLNRSIQFICIMKISYIASISYPISENRVRILANSSFFVVFFAILNG